MNTSELIKEIKKLPVSKRIYIIEKTVHSLRESEEKKRITKVVEEMSEDYKTDADLTAFTNIDFEQVF